MVTRIAPMMPPQMLPMPPTTTISSRVTISRRVKLWGLMKPGGMCAMRPPAKPA